jgi:hypothetical protein
LLHGDSGVGKIAFGAALLSALMRLSLHHGSDLEIDMLCSAINFPANR